jgi:hypothetical protein
MFKTFNIYVLNFVVQVDLFFICFIIICFTVTNVLFFGKVVFVFVQAMVQLLFFNYSFNILLRGFIYFVDLRLCKG